MKAFEFIKYMESTPGCKQGELEQTKSFVTK